MRIINAKIFTMAGEPIENGYVEFDKNITAVGDMKDCPEKSGYDAKGAMLFPGFIDAHTHLGVCEDSLGFEGDDLKESTDPCTPQLRVIDAVNMLDPCFVEGLNAGVTCVLTGPGSANPIGGQIAAIKTYGRNIEQAIIKAPVALKFALGENPKTVYNSKKSTPSTRMATAALIREQLQKARDYAEKAQNGKREFDAKLNSLQLLFTQKLPVHFHAHRVDDIYTAIRIAKEFDLNYVIVHCTQGHLIDRELAQMGVKALCGPFMSDRSKPELKHSTPASPGILNKGGVRTSIITDHPVTPIQYLPICAGLAVREGMDYLEALKSITIYSARICGIQDRVGSIEPGKDADLVLFEQNPLSLEAKPLQVIARGEAVF